MAENQAISFFEEISKNKKLAEEVNKVVGEKISDEAKAKEIVSLAKVYGFSLTPKDVVSAGEKLSLDDLSEVSGGKGGLKSGLMAMALLAGGLGATSAVTTLMSDAATPTAQTACATLNTVGNDLNSALDETAGEYRALSDALEGEFLSFLPQDDARLERARELLHDLRVGTARQIRAAAREVPGALDELDQATAEVKQAIDEFAMARDQLRDTCNSSIHCLAWYGTAAGRRYGAMLKATKPNSLVGLRAAATALRDAVAPCRADVERYRTINELRTKLVDARCLAYGVKHAKFDFQKSELFVFVDQEAYVKLNTEMSFLDLAIRHAGEIRDLLGKFLAFLKDHEWTTDMQRKLEALEKGSIDTEVTELKELVNEVQNLFDSLSLAANKRFAKLSANEFVDSYKLLVGLCNEARDVGVASSDPAVVSARELLERLCAAPSDLSEDARDDLQVDVAKAVQNLRSTVTDTRNTPLDMADGH